MCRQLSLSCYLTFLIALLLVSAAAGANLGGIDYCKDSQEPCLKILAKPAVYNVGEQKAIFCEGKLLEKEIKWLSPTGSVVSHRTSTNKRIFVDKPKGDQGNYTLLSLVIKNTEVEDTGNWTCNAGELSQNIYILVGEKAVFDKSSIALALEEGRNLRLNCSTTGIPPPTYTWYKDGVIINPEINTRKYVIRKMQANFQLEIKNVNRTDAGSYMCKVTQETLSHYATTTADVYVEHKPLFYDEVTNDVIYTTEEEVFAVENETKNITCRTLAYPPPEYTWVKRSIQNEPIDPELIDRSPDGKSSTLMLKMIDSDSFGEYQCTARNKKGHLNRVFHVNAGNKPDPPDWAEQVTDAISNDNITINVTCSSCNMQPSVVQDPKNLTVLGFSFQFAPVQEGYDPDWDAGIIIDVDVVDPEDTIFVVGPLPNNTKFHTRVRSRNAAGYSNWLELLDTTKTSGSIMLTAFVLIIAMCTSISLYSNK